MTNSNPSPLSKDGESGFGKKAKLTTEESGSKGSGSRNGLNSVTASEVTKQQKEKEVSNNHKPTAAIAGTVARLVSMDWSNWDYYRFN